MTVQGPPTRDTRPLTADERDFIEALLGGVRSGVGRYIGQLERVVVVGSCGCGCPSIDLGETKPGASGAVTPLILADAESPEGVSVGIILWVRNGLLSGLELHGWDGSEFFRLPRPETLCNLRVVG